MKILMLAPQPFFEERGTPIAVDLLLRGLSERGEEVDLLTYHLGKDMEYAKVSIKRIPNIPFIKNISPGFSFSKIVCDFFMLIRAVPMAAKNRYQYTHAVEEAVFIAMLLKALYKIPYVYDMDSSLSQQLMESSGLFAPYGNLLRWFEKLAIRHSTAVVPVCEAIYNQENKGPEKVVFLKDVTLLESSETQENEDIRVSLEIQGPVIMYVGNLEQYQGIDLLLESFQLASKRQKEGHLVVIGGKADHIAHYSQLAEDFGIKERVHFLGPRPVERLGEYLSQADILVSPRIKGKNTPMKIYSYLDSEKALLATDIDSHTQVLTSNVALLAEPTPESFSEGIVLLLKDRDLCIKLGQAGKRLVDENHTWEVYRKGLNGLYDWLAVEAENGNGSQSNFTQGADSKRLPGPKL
jgi:glycosyltransferase involved in cell wall biosynthesis